MTVAGCQHMLKSVVKLTGTSIIVEAILEADDKLSFLACTQPLDDKNVLTPQTNV